MPRVAPKATLLTVLTSTLKSLSARNSFSLACCTDLLYASTMRNEASSRGHWCVGGRVQGDVGMWGCREVGCGNVWDVGMCGMVAPYQGAVDPAASEPAPPAPWSCQHRRPPVSTWTRPALAACRRSCPTRRTAPARPPARPPATPFGSHHVTEPPKHRVQHVANPKAKVNEKIIISAAGKEKGTAESGE